MIRLLRRLALAALLAAAPIATVAQTSGSQGQTPVAPSGLSTAPLPQTIFQSATNLNGAPTVSAAATAATVALNDSGPQVVCIRGIAIYATGATGAVTLTVQTSGTTVLDLGSITLTVGNAATLFGFGGGPLACSTAGLGMSVSIGAGVTGEITHTSVIADRQ